MAFTDTWNEAYPAGTTYANELDTAITQGVKRALRERLAVDHDFRDDEAGAEDTQAPTGTVGYHKKVTLTERSSDPTNVANAGILYVKDDGGDTELFFEDDSGNVIQITKDGALTGVLALTGAQEAAGVKTFHDQAVFEAGAAMSNQQVTGLCLENRTNDTGCTQTGRIWVRTDI